MIDAKRKTFFQRLQGNFFAGTAVGVLITIGSILLFELIDEPAFILLIGVFVGFGVFQGVEQLRRRD